jgi:hypothetical protein
MSTYEWLGTTSTAWATGANWSPSGPPADTDTAIFNHRGTAATGVAGSDQSLIELAILRVDSTFVYPFGTDLSPVIVDATLVEIGRPSNGPTAGAHSGRINLSLPDVASTIRVYGTKSSTTDSGKEPVRIKTGANANNLFMTGSGRVGIATDAAGDTAQFTTVACLHTDATIVVGSGTTLTNWRQEAGTGYLYGALTTWKQDAGTAYQYGSGAITTANVGGTSYLNSSGTITTLNVYSGGHADLSDSLAKTVTTINLYKGAKLTYDPSVITVTNPINLVGCSTEDVTILTPEGLTVAIVKS